MTEPVIQRRYTIGEIDAIREKEINKLYHGVYDIKNFRMGWSSGGYTSTERSSIIEDRVRTIMMAGLTADDLVDKDSLK